MKKNCWEHKKCGRQPGGDHVHDQGTCPATKEERLSGVHGGTNGGRSCWVVAGTLCEGKLQGSYAVKYKNCSECDFYKTVRDQEFPNFILSVNLLQRLQRPL